MMKVFVKSKEEMKEALVLLQQLNPAYCWATGHALLDVPKDKLDIETLTYPVCIVVWEKEEKITVMQDHDEELDKQITVTTFGDRMVLVNMLTVSFVNTALKQMTLEAFFQKMVPDEHVADVVRVWKDFIDGKVTVTDRHGRKAYGYVSRGHDSAILKATLSTLSEYINHVLKNMMKGR